MDPCIFNDQCTVPGRRRRQEFVPLDCADLNYTDVHREFCDNDRDCMCDLVATGDPTLAADTRDGNRNFTMQVTQLSEYNNY